MCFDNYPKSRYNFYHSQKKKKMKALVPDVWNKWPHNFNKWHLALLDQFLKICIMYSDIAT